MERFPYGHMAASALVSLLESSLIIFAVLRPVLAYSPASLLFSVARIAVSAHAGASFNNSAKSSFLAGASSMFSGIFVICAAEIASRVYGWGSILGISPPGTVEFALLLALIMVENALVGGVFAAGAGWLAKRVAGKPVRPRRGLRP